MTRSSPLEPHDTKDRLTNETSNRQAGWNQNNAYDGASNPTTFANLTRTYNANNQFTMSGNTYDGNGNPTTYAGTAFTYDVENRVTSTSGALLTSGYRADGLRAWKQAGSSPKTYFLYDGGNPVVELDGSGNVKHINVYAPDGLVARKKRANCSTTPSTRQLRRPPPQFAPLTPPPPPASLQGEGTCRRSSMRTQTNQPIHMCGAKCGLLPSPEDRLYDFNEKLVPHPQLRAALGLSNVKPPIRFPV